MIIRNREVVDKLYFDMKMSQRVELEVASSLTSHTIHVVLQQ